MHVEAGRCFPLDQLPPTQIQQRQLHDTHSTIYDIIYHRKAPGAYLLPSSPDRRNTGFGLVICVVPGLKAQSVSNPRFPLGRAIMSSSSVTACSRSPSPATPDTSEIPDNQVSLKSWCSTVPSNAVSCSLTLTLIGLSSFPTASERKHSFSRPHPRNSLRQVPNPKPWTALILTITIQFCPSRTSLYLCGHGRHIPEPFIAPYATTCQDHQPRNHQRPTNQTRSSSSSGPARC